MLVHNPLTSYSRAVRFGRSLARAGWEVTLAGIPGEGTPAEERLAVDPGTPEAGSLRVVRVAHMGWPGALLTFAGRVDRVLVRMRLPSVAYLLGSLLWPLDARAWARGLEALPHADLYHGCGLRAAWAARHLARRAQHAGRAGRAIYDLIDIFMESGVYARLRGVRRRLYRRREARLVHDVDGRVSVSTWYADDAARRFGLAEPPVVVWNGPFRSEIPDRDTDVVRAAAGLPRGRAIVLFLGRFVPFAGLLEAGDAVLRLPDAAFVAVGQGELGQSLRARDSEPARAGRHVTLPPVAVEEVPRWAAGADVTIFLSRARDLNQRWVTPNKLWESLAGGTPLVFGDGLEAMRAILEPDGLGQAVPVGDPERVADALRRFTEAPPDERDARRARARALIRERYAWDVSIPRYLELVDRLVPLTDGG